MTGIPQDQQVNLKLLCEMLDLTPQRIAQLVNDGVIPRSGRGRYELVPAVKSYIGYLRKRPTNVESVGDDDYGTQRTRLTKAKADMAEMEKEQMANSLIPANDVSDAWETMVSNMRARLLSIPTKSATSVFAANDVIDAKRILKENINEALRELSTIEIRTNNPIRSTDAGDDSDQDAKTSGSTTRTKDK